MGSKDVAAGDFWGSHLINGDKSPTFVFEQLLLGIANYINEQIAPWDVHCLTPAKLAAFYRLVGGNYDLLFLEKSQSLSFIYQSMGCFHTLQPERDPFAAPAIPALTPQGFVRWQTVQLLLGPEKHVPFLQEAVKRFEITNPADGLLFPTLLPKEILPDQPDMKMTEWYSSVSENLKLEAQASQMRQISIGLDLESSRESSIDSQHLVGAAIHTHHNRPIFRSPNFVSNPPCPPPTRSPRNWNAQQDPPPWSPERRRHSLPNDQQDPGRPSSSSRRDGPTPIGFSPTTHYMRPRSSRPRSPSTLSTTSSSSSSSSSLTASSASLSPRPPRPSTHRIRHQHAQTNTHNHGRHQPPTFHLQPPPPSTISTRRHSTDSSPQPQPSAPLQISYFPSPNPAPPRSNAKGLNVRWRDVDTLFELPRSMPGTPGEADEPRMGMRLVEGGKGSDAERGRGKMVSPLRGVGGRRYATEGIAWRGL